MDEPLSWLLLLRFLSVAMLLLREPQGLFGDFFSGSISLNALFDIKLKFLTANIMISNQSLNMCQGQLLLGVIIIPTS